MPVMILNIESFYSFIFVKAQVLHEIQSSETYKITVFQAQKKEQAVICVICNF